MGLCCEELGLRESGGTLLEVGERDSGVSQGRNSELGIRRSRGKPRALGGVSGECGVLRFTRTLSGEESSILKY